MLKCISLTQHCNFFCSSYISNLLYLHRNHLQCVRAALKINNFTIWYKVWRVCIFFALTITFLSKCIFACGTDIYWITFFMFALKLCGLENSLLNSNFFCIYFFGARWIFINWMTLPISFLEGLMKNILNKYPVHLPRQNIFCPGQN